MPKKVDVKQSYVVFTYVNGLKLYLSIMGGFNNKGYNYMWDMEISNARDFSTKKEAKAHGEAAVKQNRQAQGVFIIKKLVHRNGMIEVKK